MAGTKHDQEKAMMHLLDPFWLEGVSMVMTYGAGKYDPENWREGLAWTRIIASTFRHLLEIMKGNDIDAETQLPHAAHIACNSMFLFHYLKNNKNLDDRWYSKKTVTEVTVTCVDEKTGKVETINV